MGRTEQARTTDVDFYTQPSAMTSPGSHGPLLSELPNEVGDLARIIQHLVVYDVVAPEFYGFTIVGSGNSDRLFPEILTRSAS